jgi:nucleotide-binding universal stress UspA family protein
MLPYKKVIAALNLTQLDKNVIVYSGLLSKLSDCEEVKFLYTNRKINYPLLQDAAGLGSEESVDQFAIRVMRDEVSTDFSGDTNTKIAYEALEGDPLEMILKTVVQDKTDLIVVGRKRSALDTRRLPVKLARKAPCSVVMVPENAEPSISRIMVPVDFSNGSERALKMAVDLAIAGGIKKIYGIHVFFLPLGYSKTGKTGVEYARMMKIDAENHFNDFIKQVDLKGVEIKMDYIISRRPAKAIRKAVRKRGCDLIIAGARGDGGLGMLGSVTESLMLTVKCPMVAVKRKGYGLAMLKTLLLEAHKDLENEARREQPTI